MENDKNSEVGTDDKALLKRIRERYRYSMDKWRRIREEGQKNIRYVSGDPWDDADKQLRQGRPTVCADELNQYVNQVVNTARMSPRGIKIDPAGDLATDELAEYRENRIRAIEYACNAPQAYLNGLQAAVERNIGYWRVSRAYVADDSDEQEIVILPVMNPDAILIDPDFKELDGSDIRYAFELDRIPVDVFKQEYPDASVDGFAAEDMGEDRTYWSDEKTILTASYWEIKTVTKQVGKKGRNRQSRTVTQYITNGVSILKKGEVQPGPYIPIIPVFGKELWVDYGSGAERFLLSLVSLARDPQKALSYVMSSMLESCGQIPKSPYIGYVGQFETDSDAWDTINNVYHTRVQVDPITDPTNGSILPLPQRQSLTPDFAAYSVGSDICRRAIQAAMGISPLPTAAQRQNQKSGVALEKIQSQQAVGSYHLVDAYDRAIKLTGRIVNNWLAETDLGETKRAIREADGTHKLVSINTDQPVVENDHVYHFPIADDKGRYQVTVSTGNSTESQRQEASDFADTLVQNLQGLPVAPPQAAKILSMVVRMKQLGPMGDQIADIISPQDNGPQQQLVQLQQQGAQMQQAMQEMQQTLQKLMLERQGKVIEMQGKQQLAELDAQVRLTEANLDRETKLAVAEIGTKAQITSEREQMVSDLEAQFHSQAHEQAMSVQEHQQAQDLAAQQAAHQQDAQQQAAEQAAQQAQPQDGAAQ